MFWSQPKPCTNISVAGPEPATCTLLRSWMLIHAFLVGWGWDFSMGGAPRGATLLTGAVAGAEDGGADPHHRAAGRNGGFEVRRHAHGQGVQRQALVTKGVEEFGRLAVDGELLLVSGGGF